MSSYSATLITKSATGTLITGAGSFANIRIDGRYSIEQASEIARYTFQKEAKFKKSEYMGFAIEKTQRIADYKSPLIVDNDSQAKDILFLL